LSEELGNVLLPMCDMGKPCPLPTVTSSASLYGCCTLKFPKLADKWFVAPKSASQLSPVYADAIAANFTGGCFL
jgi:hypothetical protein